MATPKDLAFLTLHPFIRSTAEDKLFGSIFGSALGDCIGLYTEFLPATKAASAYPDGKFSLYPTPTKFRADGHRDRFEEGGWTDDTDHALLLVLSFLHNKGEILPGDFAARLAVWVREGLRCLGRRPLGIGQTVGTIARDPEFRDRPGEIAARNWVYSGRVNAANGSLMRTHPLGGMCVGLPLEETFWIAANVSRTTHVDPRCMVACCVSVGLIRGMLRGEILTEDRLDTLLEEAFTFVASQETLRNPSLATEPPLKPSEAERLLNHEEFTRHVHAPSLTALELDDSMKMGYVYKCLGAAIFSLRMAMRETQPHLGKPPSQSVPTIKPRPPPPPPPRPSVTNLFESLITSLIMQGGDADTNACAAGALLGTFLGYSRLPTHWTLGLKHREWLWEKTRRLSILVGIAEISEGDGEVDEGSDDTDLYGGKAPMTERELRKMESDIMVEVLVKQRERNRLEREREEERKNGKGRLGKWLRG
jgi:ADP-ribosylglycohydrolase